MEAKKLTSREAAERALQGNKLPVSCSFPPGSPTFYPLTPLPLTALSGPDRSSLTLPLRKHFNRCRQSFIPCCGFVRALPAEGSGICPASTFLLINSRYNELGRIFASLNRKNNHVCRSWAAKIPGLFCTLIIFIPDNCEK